MKKVLVWTICLALLLTVVPFGAFAASFGQEEYIVNYYTDASMKDANIITLSAGSGVTYTSSDTSILKPVDEKSGKFEVLKESFNGNSYSPKAATVTASNGATTKVYTTATNYSPEKALYTFDRQSMDLAGSAWSVLDGTKALGISMHAKTSTSYCYRFGGTEAPYYSMDNNAIGVKAGGKVTLRFVAPREGEAILPATKLGTPTGGAKMSILHNGKVLYPTSGQPEAKTNYEEISLTLKKGDKIDFVLSGGDADGTQTWKPSVRYIRPRLNENPLGLTVDTKYAVEHIAAESTTSEVDTLQLAQNLGQAEITVSGATEGSGTMMADATSYQDVGSNVVFDKTNGKIVATFGDKYKGGRALESLQLALYAHSGTGSQYNVEFFYTTTANKTKEVHFASFYEDEVLGRAVTLYPILQIENASAKVKDVYQIIVYINGEEANSKITATELDVFLKGDGADITTARTTMNETIRFASIYGTNALFQRDKDLTVWGFGGRNQVKVQLLKGETEVSSAIATVKDGKWEVTLPPVAGSHDKYTLRATDVDAAQNRAESTNILFGDVWIVGGQSNSCVTVAESENVREAIDNANDDGIRYFDQLHYGARFPADEPVEGVWSVAVGSEVRYYSAMGYFFAKTLYEKLDKKVPIGLMHAGNGSTSVESWMPESLLDSNPAYKKWNEFNIPFKEYTLDYYCRRPVAPYNGMLYPLSVLNVTGALWYQGNTNGRRDVTIYNDLMIDMIAHWRELFNNPEMPFFTVQLEGVSSTYHPEVREQQMMTMMTVENSGMATAIDVGERNNVHPKYKQQVGDRLAAIAYAKTYGFGGEYCGPLWQSVTKDGSDIVVSFTHANGLKLTTGSTVNHIEISADGSTYTPATAVVEGNTIRVKNVGDATWVRYAWIDFPDPALNLYNGEDFPAFPFAEKVGATNKAEPPYTAPVITLPGESAPAVTPSISFADVENHWGKPYILPLAEAGIIKGKSEGIFDPDGQITRAEFLTLALKVAGITASGNASYPDVGTDTWFAATVATAKEKGLIDPNMTLDGNFYPDQNITREEMTSVIVKLYEAQKGATAEGDVSRFSDAATFSPWASASVGKAVALGVVTGNPDGTFNARGNATRAEAAVIFSRLQKLL